MRRIFIFMLIFLMCPKVEAQQKTIIDTSMLYKGLYYPWPDITGDIIATNDGRYVAYTIQNQPVGSKSLVVKEINGSWKKDFISSEIRGDFYFSIDSKLLCWQKGDSLLLQSLGNDRSSLLGVVELCRTPVRLKGKWLAYQKKESSRDLILLDLVNSKSQIYKDVEDILFDDFGNSLLLKLKNADGNILKRIDLRLGKSTIIWSGSKDSKISNYQFDRSGKQIAFIVEESAECTVYYYNTGMDKAVKRLDNDNKMLANGLMVGRINGFSLNGKWLFIKLNKPKGEKFRPNESMSSVDIWSYHDVVLQSVQSSHDLGQEYSNLSVDLVLEVAKKTNGILLNNDGLINRGLTYMQGDNVLLSSDTVKGREYWWPYIARPSEFLVSLKDGSRRGVLIEHKDIVSPLISPGGNWVTWWDANEGAWMSYEIATGITNNLSRLVPFKLSTDAEYIPSALNCYVAPIAAWSADDKALYLYDNYDIWKIDPACRIAPINITGGYGRKNNIELQFPESKEGLYFPLTLIGNEEILLTAYNRENKHNGFFTVKLNEPGKVRYLTMGPYCWSRPTYRGHRGGMEPLSVGSETQNKGWVLMRQSGSECSNYFYTNDFKTLKALTNFTPQSQYNWMTTELVNWSLPDGRESHGVLFKPENFDSTKKYPVIFNIYEKQTYRMYDFLGPGLTDGNINIPWFVSHGYLVFLPDIYYGSGTKTDISSGRYACNAVESAAHKLIERPYIDPKRLAIQGHSFGGFETNYILTHSNLFAAAAETAGFSNAISSYLTLAGVGHGSGANMVDMFSVQQAKERNHGSNGDNPWQAQSLFLDNSPVLSADKTSTPLLICHNKKDNQVQWRQGIEMYMALRRLSKPSWMLQYDDSGHGLDTPKDQLDYTIRLEQFFDHYLKDRPAPRWMTQGIPAKLKQVENRYELDPNGSCGKDCKVCKKWNDEQVESIKTK